MLCFPYFPNVMIFSDSLFKDNHDIISLKLYQLTVLRSQKEDEEEDEVTIPSVDNMDLIRSKTHSQSFCQPSLSFLHPSSFYFSSSLPVGETEEGMSGIAIFFTALFSMLGCIFLVVIGLVVYSHWNESRRKRFYWGRRRGDTWFYY